jgi:hypothetical protein
MAEKPILFSAPMINAILNGQKTMTRRVIKMMSVIATIGGVPYVEDQHGDWRLLAKFSPYHVGDTLWVRETWCPLNLDYEAAPRNVSVPLDGANVIVSYRADHIDPRGDAKPLQWRPSIFMPRWASRITLRVTGVRAEQLQDITPDDCIREGVNWVEAGPYFADITGSFRLLWDGINAKRGYGWDANPYVWVVSFEKA